MNLLTSIQQFASGSAIADTVSPALSLVDMQNGSLGGLGAIPGLTAVSDTISSMTSVVSTKWKSTLSQLPIALPAMKSVHILEKKMEMVAGGVASSAASATFDSYFGTMDGIKAKMADIQASVASSFTALASVASTVPGVVGAGLDALKSLAGQIPAATIPDPANPGKNLPNPAYVAFMASAAIGSLSTQAGGLKDRVAAASVDMLAKFAAADADYAKGMNLLKGLAFASFCAQPQPAPVRDVINRTINQAAIPSVDSLARFNRSGSEWMGSQMAASRDWPPAIARKNPDAARQIPVSTTKFVPTQSSTAQLDAIDGEVSAQREVVKAASRSADEAGRAFTAWQDSVDYAAVKNNKDTNPDAYKALHARAMQTPEYLDMSARLDKYNAELAKYNALIEKRQHMLSTGPVPGSKEASK